MDQPVSEGETALIRATIANLATALAVPVAALRREVQSLLDGAGEPLGEVESRQLRTVLLVCDNLDQLNRDHLGPTGP